MSIEKTKYINARIGVVRVRCCDYCGEPVPLKYDIESKSGIEYRICDDCWRVEMIHLTEDLMDAISKLKTLDIPDDSYVSTPYKYGKVLLMRQGSYWGITIDDKEESASLNFYGESKRDLASKAISYIEVWIGAGL